ncbi:xanthine phosphoribosyltransferase [Anaerovorax odorimutans]|uniref:xanthine phosphoribosyltransferase n=1 Tax=Anaerovorax odorimutans TaxID=109327 RepID=UPI000406DE79|nr:xanthine phosphoribosyltransferase [Anaerovorax odorimutans]
MQALKNRIIKDGVAIGTEILKVDSFLNHQIDVEFLSELGKEFKNRFKDKEINKILTVEASGIAIACMAAEYFGNPLVVFAKKTSPNTMTDEFYGAEVKSFTKGTTSIVRVSKKYIEKGDKILILDDFLAHGEAAMGMAELVEMGGAEVVGIGAVIEKQFQGGSKKLKEKGYQVESLAVIQSINDGIINFI